MIWTKGAHQSAKFQTFDCSSESSPNLYFHRLLLLKVYKISAKKVQRIMSHGTEEWCQILRKMYLLFQRWQEFGEFWFKHSEVSKSCAFISPFCAKYIMFDLNKYRVLSKHERKIWKTWRKTDLWFRKIHAEISKFSPEHLKLSKLGLWWDLLSKVENVGDKKLQRSYL